eukprot:s1754_g1.t2
MVLSVICAWLRNDLRVHDSPVLSRAAQLSKEQKLPVLPVYFFDPRQFQQTQFGTLKTGAFRALFLLQSVRVLKRRLRAIGSDLLIQVGKPEELLPKLLDKKSIVLTQEEVTSEELRVDNALRQSLKDAAGCEAFEYCWGSTLFHKDDLPFQKDLRDAPDVFTSFKNQVEPEMAARVNEVPDSFRGNKKSRSAMGVRACLPELRYGDLPLPSTGASLDFELIFEPEWKDRCLGDLHITAGCEVMVIKRDRWRLVSPGVSRYNDAYLCTVKEVREAGYRAVEVDFDAMGDGSMGSLQCPASSRLMKSADDRFAGQDLPYATPVDEPTLPETAAIQFQGGEELTFWGHGDAALARLQYYLFESNHIAKYFETRNGMLGPDYSTKFAPWLAFGCLSPRKIFEQIREYEKQKVANKSTYWVLFELMWRDFFRFFAAKHGNQIFKLHGIAGGRDWKSDMQLFQLWAEGQTGYPLVDANMRELRSSAAALERSE